MRSREILDIAYRATFINTLSSYLVLAVGNFDSSSHDAAASMFESTTTTEETGEHFDVAWFLLRSRADYQGPVTPPDPPLPSSLFLAKVVI